MSKSSEAVSRHRQKRRAELVYIMGDKCAICGYHKTIAALEFHHLDQTKKEYQLSNGNCKRIEQDIEEAKKCILVCANCHREIHMGLIDNSSLSSSFNEKRAQEILALYHKEPVAPIQKQQAITMPPVSRNELKQLIRCKPFTQIGKQFSVTDNAIRKWCDRYGLPRTKKEIDKYTDTQWEKI